MIKYEEVTPSPIINARVQKAYRDNYSFVYYITPLKGYVLHDKRMDENVINPETMIPTGEVNPGFRKSTASCPQNYDFSQNLLDFYVVEVKYDI